ncbi:hypothetical protein E4P41_09560 [Geodermatophilus sp. DF01-2]|uniref:hypothetical protein n=1 Tax=Geodermatophilus sp. DF01-2 TaxID=2559610 RepID=UPI001073D30A|nr:hypothetical protein [Geodermatophilus sp. DF01_2]TFV61656.1 hypothetical protein E4P41_09560 [Geodermatophilus sp. DF01_2]
MGTLLCAGIAVAGPAAAVDDPARPDARVTHGPSCRPGGVVVEVTGGTAGYAVTLATSRLPGGEASAEVGPGAVVVLSTGPVDWGETIDPYLEYVPLDGSGAGYVDELVGYSFTRPAHEDCAAIAPPTGAGVVPTPGGTPPAVAGPAPDGEVVPMPVPGLPDPGSVGPVDAAGEPPAVTVSAREVVAGQEVTLRGKGFGPGEPVTVRVADAVLTSVVASPDGSVETAVRIPTGTSAGQAVLELVGGESASSAAVALQVAAAATPLPLPDGGVLWPLLAAGSALLAAGVGLAVVSGGRRPGARPGGPAPFGSA